MAIKFDDEIVSNFLPDIRSSGLEENLCQQVMTKLWQTYPGWTWWVDVPPGQGVVVIKNLTINPKGKYGMCLRIRDIETKMHIVMRLAGELLERFHKQRGAKQDKDDTTIEQHFAVPEGAPKSRAVH